MLKFDGWHAYSDTGEPFRQWKFHSDVPELHARKDDHLEDRGPHRDPAKRFRVNRYLVGTKEWETQGHPESWQVAALLGGRIPEWGKVGEALRKVRGALWTLTDRELVKASAALAGMMGSCSNRAAEAKKVPEPIARLVEGDVRRGYRATIDIPDARIWKGDIVLKFGRPTPAAGAVARELSRPELEALRVAALESEPLEWLGDEGFNPGPRPRSLVDKRSWGLSARTGRAAGTSCSRCGLRRPSSSAPRVTTRPSSSSWRRSGAACRREASHDSPAAVREGYLSNAVSE